MHAADGRQFVELLVELFECEHVVVGVLLRAVERAELAVHIADIRVVDVAVHDVGDHARAMPLVGVALREIAPDIRQLAEFIERQPVEVERVVANSLKIEPPWKSQRAHN